MADVLKMLENDHREVEQMLEQLAGSEPGSERDELVDRLVRSLQLHMSFEEEAVYPLLKELDGELEEEAEIEHQLARDGLSKLGELASQPGFGAAVDMVTAGISHHVEEEEGDAWPKLREALDEDTLTELAASLRRQKAEAGLDTTDGDERSLDEATKDELLERAKEAGVEGRSSMTKDELREALTN